MVDSNNKYTKMQQKQYDHEASLWTNHNRNFVVGNFDNHNNWQDYDDFLFKDIDITNKLALDFGCGPGRNIVKFWRKFNRIDGIDISQTNLNKAANYCKENNIKFDPVFYKSNGIDLNNITSDFYDIVFSTICLQHICVYEIRFNLLKEMHRVLKAEGSICIQMGLGNKGLCVNYFDNYYDATGTNGAKDVSIQNVDDLKQDLENIGFVNFSYDIRPVGPGDGAHNHWIFFRAHKI